MQQAPTLRQVLSKYPLSMAHVLSGADALDTPVTKFGVLDAPDATMFVQENELVVTSGFIFSNNEALLLDVVKQLIHKKAAAFGVKLERKYVSIPESIIEYAKQNSFAIIALPLTITWYELASILFSFGAENSAQATDLSLRSENVYNTVEYFFSSMKNLVDISQIPTLIHEFFGLACMVYNINSNAVIACPEKYPLTEDVDIAVREFEVKNAKVENSSALYRHYLMNGQSLLVSTLAFNNVYFGHIIVVESPNQILDDITLEESLRYILLMIRLRCRDVFELTRNDLVIRNNLIIDFITHPHEEKDIIRIQALAGEYGLKLQNTNYLVLFSPDSKAASDHTPQHIITSAVLELIPKLYNLYSVIGGWKNDNLFFCIIPYRDEAHANKLLSKITGYIQSRITDVPLKFGVSLPAAINETNTGYQQAAAALNICKDNDLAQNITFFDPFDLRNVLTDPKMISHFNHYYEKYLKPIEEYDSAHEGTLMKTLRMYFEKNREIKPCADALFVHQNTIRYRLDQISQIANIDFDDRNTVMMLALCTLIYPFLEHE